LIFVAMASATSDLAPRLSAIAAEAQGQVFMACALPKVRLDCNLRATGRPPMQSVFKFPLVLAALRRIEQGEFHLDQPIRFLPGDRILPTSYSPLQDKYPNANVDVPLRELMRLAVSLSDNAASEVLLRILGGPGRVTKYVHSLGIRGFMLQDGEATLHRDDQAQYRNWFEPRAAVKLLRLLHDRSPLNAEHTALLQQWMTESPTGPKRIKGLLPATAIVTHKTGTSGVRQGVTAATNDMALITLPNGKRLALAIFVTDAKAAPEVIESVIARLAKAVYDEAGR